MHAATIGTDATTDVSVAPVLGPDEWHFRAGVGVGGGEVSVDVRLGRVGG